METWSRHHSCEWFLIKLGRLCINVCLCPFQPGGPNAFEVTTRRGRDNINSSSLGNSELVSCGDGDACGQPQDFSGAERYAYVTRDTKNVSVVKHTTYDGMSHIRESFQSETFRQRLQTSSWHHGDILRGNSIPRISINGFSTVIKGRLIVFIFCKSHFRVFD